MQREVLDFVEFLEYRGKERMISEEEPGWSDFSLASAMRWMEHEETPYTETDLKEAFK